MVCGFCELKISAAFSPVERVIHLLTYWTKSWMTVYHLLESFFPVQSLKKCKFSYKWGFFSTSAAPKIFEVRNVWTCDISTIGHCDHGSKHPATSTCMQELGVFLDGSLSSIYTLSKYTNGFLLLWNIMIAFHYLKNVWVSKNFRSRRFFLWDTTSKIWMEFMEKCTLAGVVSVIRFTTEQCWHHYCFRDIKTLRLMIAKLKLSNYAHHFYIVINSDELSKEYTSI